MSLTASSGDDQIFETDFLTSNRGTVVERRRTR